MNASARLAIAILVSLLAHAILLTSVIQVKVRAHNDHGLLEVFLPPYTNGHDRQPFVHMAETGPSAVNNFAEGKAQKPIDTASHSQLRARDLPVNGHFRWQPPSSYRQDEVMNAMQMAQLAHQRQSRIAAILNGLSNLSAHLDPLTTGKIACIQQPNTEIECTPEPEEQIRPLLLQFFKLALESRQLGIAGNPVRMDFGAERGVSVTLLR